MQHDHDTAFSFDFDGFTRAALECTKNLHSDLPPPFLTPESRVCYEIPQMMSALPTTFSQWRRPLAQQRGIGKKKKNTEHNKDNNNIVPHTLFSSIPPPNYYLQPVVKSKHRVDF